jgi:transcriptional regulator with XRE-family HTH domain
MGGLQIGARIAEHRKKKGITQEELACHMGVSKPAVSKWESGQSYPDILLLPLIAAYFDITIDELVGYEPQMTKEEVRMLSHKLADDFTKEPFDQVLARCEDYLKKYYSCWQLQVLLGLLLLNHASLSGSPEKTTEVVTKVLDIFKRVEKSSDDVHLAKQSVQLQALCYVMLQEPAMAIDLLEEGNEPQMSTEPLLIKAYQMKGDTKKATEYLQGYVYVSLMNILGAVPDFLNIYSSNKDKLDRYYSIFIGLCNLFEVESLHPAALMQIELSASMVFAAQGDKEKALDALEHSVEQMCSFSKGDGKIMLKGNDIFDALEQYLEDIDVDTAAPRTSATIWTDLKKLIKENPAFACLWEEKRYKDILIRIESI